MQAGGAPHLDQAGQALGSHQRASGQQPSGHAEHANPHPYEQHGSRPAKGGNRLLLWGGIVLACILCCVAAFYGLFLLPDLADGSGFKLDARKLLIIGVLTGLMTLAVVSAMSFLQATRRAKRAQSRAAEDVRRLQRDLQAAKDILLAEPQILIFWESTGEPRVVMHTLDETFGVPLEAENLLRFRGWVEPDSASELEAGLNALFQTGHAFNVMLKTTRGTYLESDGRAAGGRLILKFRDLAGRRQELAHICDQHRKLERDIAAKRTLLDAVPMPVWFRGEDQNLNWVNRSYCEAVEAKNVDEVLERQMELLEMRQRDAVNKALTNGDTYNHRLHTIIGGERRAYDAIVLPLGDESAGIAIDVAALETAKGELERHMEAHTRTLDRVSSAIAIFGPDQKLNFFNQAYVDLWQLDTKWLEGKPRDGEILDRLRAMSHLPEQADFRDWKQQILERYQTSEAWEDWWHLPDGRSLHIVAEHRPDGGMTYLYDDATEQLALESRYNALFRVQKETLENLREGVAVFASNGRLTLHNPTFAAIWKLNIDELEKKPHIDEIIAKCRVLHDGDQVWYKIKRAVTAIYDTRQSVDGQLQRADGSVIAYACQPLPDGATMLTYIDVTDTKRVERALIERNEALEAGDKLKNDFIQNISYELRTPLTNIIGFAEMLSSQTTGALNDKQREYLNDIRSSSDTLQAIINDILDLATLDAGALELTVDKIKVETVIKAAALGVRERLIRAHIGLDIRVDQNIKDFVADEKRVTQVLYHLLSNAIGFSKEKSRIALLCQLEDEMVCFSIVDQGVGMSEYYQKVAFDRFESNSHGAKHRGVGLGLSIVRSMVELHGGDVTLNSKVGEGTVVKVRFPLHGAQSTPGESDENRIDAPKFLRQLAKTGS